VEQRELGLLALLRAPDLVRGDILRSFGDSERDAMRRAIRWSWDNRRVKTMDQGNAANHCGIKAPHFSEILNGKKYLPPEKINAYEWITGWRAVTLTIDRFRTIREEENALELARAFVASGGRRA
jgi:hypothetical protein